MSDKPIRTICIECNSMVRTCLTADSIKPDTRYKAFCKCEGKQVLFGRSEKRVMKSFKKYNQTKEV